MNQRGWGGIKVYANIVNKLVISKVIQKIFFGDMKSYKSYSFDVT